MSAKGKDNKSNNTLDLINNRLASIEEKMDFLNIKVDKEKSKGLTFFQASTLFATGLVIVSIALSILIQLISSQEAARWATCISYFIVGIILISISLKLVEKRH